MTKNNMISDTPQNDVFNASEIVTLKQESVRVNDVNEKTNTTVDTIMHNTPWYKNEHFYLMGGLTTTITCMVVSVFFLSGPI